MEELILQGLVISIRTARRSGILSGKTDEELGKIEKRVDKLITDKNSRVLSKLDLIK